jgi:hypothetical protein
MGENLWHTSEGINNKIKKDMFKLELIQREYK